jgi:hypothetical protein
MANALLDFVMSVVRDPDIAARYAADPAQTIAEAHLTGVTSADVQNLIPVVSESLSMAAPTHSLDHFGAEPVDNVWASGAATAAFDAFTEHVTDPGIIDTHPVISDVDDHAVTDLHVPAAPDLIDAGASPQFDEPEIHDVVSADPGFADHGITDDWTHAVPDAHPGDHLPGFDLFD